eukprot:6195844-Pleurochrysis_carterae.AAC.1
MDAIRRMFSTAVVKFHLASAAGCLAIAFIHTYWIHGSHALGLVEHSNPILVTHVSRVNFILRLIAPRAWSNAFSSLRPSGS